jgi:putative ABC transport system permease protein
VYGWLLRAYPASFRDRFGAGMRGAFLQEYEELRSRPPAARAAFWAAACLEAARFGWAERRAARRGVLMRNMFTIDWRDAVRSLRATPVVTAAAVLSLALGIGANTALFSILNSLLLKTLPVRDPAQLVVIDEGSWTNPIWEQIRDRRHQIFDEAFAWSATRFNLSPAGRTDYVQGQWASGGMFDVLGVHAILGRTFTDTDDVRGGGPDGPVAVISYGFWQRHFGGAPDVIGKTLSVDHAIVTIIGVTPGSFLGVDVGRAADVTLPIGLQALMPNGLQSLTGRSTWWLEIMGRLKPGQTLEQAQAALRGVQPAIREATIPQSWKPKDQAGYLSVAKQPFTLIAAGTGESDLRKGYETPLQILMVVVAAVLLIACANLANLLLARAAARRREMSLRLALGASRFRLARQLLAESLLLGVTGASLALLVARWGSALLVRQLSTASTGVTLDLSLDWRVLMFTAGLALLTSIVFGLAPALGVSSVAPNEALKTDARTITGGARVSMRSLLVAGQIALSLCLVVAAALFLRTLSALTTAPLGFDPAPLVAANIEAPTTVADDGLGPFFEQIRENADAIPGTAGASLAVLLPGGVSSESMRWNTLVEPDPNRPPPPGKRKAPWVDIVSPGWFGTFGMHIVQGRDVDAHDTKGAPRVMVVNESFARMFFPGANPIDREVRAGIDGPGVHAFHIVGVVNDSVYRSPRNGFEPTLYIPLAQLDSPMRGMVLTVRAADGRPEALGRAVADAISRVNRAAAYTIEFPGVQRRTSARQERLVAMLGGFFGGLALLLAGLGLYGVTSYSVSRRGPEIGIRMALGANRAGVMRLVMRQVGTLIAVGVIAGIALSWWASQFVATLLFGLGPRDPLTFGIAAAAMALVGLTAGWLPAHRASRIDPVRALREN